MERINGCFIKIYQISNTKPKQEFLNEIEKKTAIKLFYQIEEWGIH